MRTTAAFIFAAFWVVACGSGFGRSGAAPTEISEEYRDATATYKYRSDLTYNSSHQLVGITEHTAGEQTGKLEFEYDASGRLDSARHVFTDGTTRTIEIDYNADGKPNRFTRARVGSSGSKVSDITYDTLSRVEEVVSIDTFLPSTFEETETFHYDAEGRLDEIELVSRSSQTPDSSWYQALSFRYNEDGSIRRISDLFQMFTSGATTFTSSDEVSYDYDLDGRLDEANYSATTTRISTRYDIEGRLEETVTNYEVGDQSTVTYTYGSSLLQGVFIPPSSIPHAWFFDLAGRSFGTYDTETLNLYVP